MGSVFGLGVFITRVVTERFRTSGAIFRVVLGTILGGIGMNISLFIFHMLFLSTPPSGLLITAGCAFIAFTFAAGGLLRSRLIRIILSIASILIAITGTWLIHINLAASPLELTPIFRYDYAWPLTQVVFTAFGVSFFMGTFGNLVDLSILDE